MLTIFFVIYEIETNTIKTYRTSRRIKNILFNKFKNEVEKYLK